MKFTTTMVATLAIFFSAITMVAAKTDDGPKSVLNRRVVAKPVLQAPQPANPVQQEVVQQPVMQQPVELAAPSVVVPMAPVAAPVANGGCCNVCCQPCCKPRRRCCPPPVPTKFCLVDPCGCPHEACVEIPACCCGEQPCIKWRNGIVGRQIATLCWECCDFEAKVIVTRNGKVRVRD